MQFTVVPNATESRRPIIITESFNGPLLREFVCPREYIASTCWYRLNCSDMAFLLHGRSSGMQQQQQQCRWGGYVVSHSARSSDICRHCWVRAALPRNQHSDNIERIAARTTNVDQLHLSLGNLLPAGQKPLDGVGLNSFTISCTELMWRAHTVRSMAAASTAASGSCRLGGRAYSKSSVDSQFADDDDDTELTVLDVCIDCDDEGLYDLIQDGVTLEQLNERDKSGRVITMFLITTNY